MRLPAIVAFRYLSAATFLPAIVTVMAGLAGPSLRGESCADNQSPQTVILDRFEARDATVADVLEALVLRTEKATRRAYRPNLVIIGDVIGRMKVSVSLTNAPLSDALDRIGELPGVQVTYRSNQTVIFSMKEG